MNINCFISRFKTVYGFKVIVCILLLVGSYMLTSSYLYGNIILPSRMISQQSLAEEHVKANNIVYNTLTQKPNGDLSGKSGKKMIIYSDNNIHSLYIEVSDTIGWSALKVGYSSDGLEEGFQEPEYIYEPLSRGGNNLVFPDKNIHYVVLTVNDNTQTSFAISQMVINKPFSLHYAGIVFSSVLIILIMTYVLIGVQVKKIHHITKDSFKSFLLKLAPVMIIFFTFLIFSWYYANCNQAYFDKKGIYFDSRTYWSLAKNMDVLGIFSFDNLRAGFRGYFYPAYLYMTTRLGLIICGTPESGFWICNSLQLAILLGYILPSFFTKPVSYRRRAGAAFVCAGLIIVFWRGLLIYPLSDVTAVFFLSILLLICKKRIKNSISIMPQGWPTACRLALDFFMGALIYICYSIRSVYFICGIICLIYYTYQTVKNCRNWWFNLASLLLGITIAALPQVETNMIHIGKMSPIISAAYGESDMFTFQFYTGIFTDRYEVFVGSKDEYPLASVYAVDAAGKKILQEEGIDNITGFRLADLFRLVIKYPLEFIGIYTRHLINMMTPLFPDIYSKTLSSGKAGLFLTNVIIWFMVSHHLYFQWRDRAGVSLLKNLHNKREKINIINDIFPFCILIIPVLCALPGAVEVRYALPLHFLLYVQLAYKVDYKKIFKSICAHPICNATVFLLLLLFWSTIITATLAMAQHGSLLL